MAIGDCGFRDRRLEIEIGDWRLAIGDWRLAIGDWRSYPQSTLSIRQLAQWAVRNLNLKSPVSIDNPHSKKSVVFSLQSAIR
jgi:hypothetical protein